MSCSSFDLKDYFFGELNEPDRARVNAHLEECARCREELDRLGLTQAALNSVRDEEPPRRIAFVSDRVFQPRWWQVLWNSGPRLGFASASVLAAAIVFHALAVRAPVAPAGIAPKEDTAAMEARINRETELRVNAAVRAAVAESESRQAKKAGQLVEAARREFEFQRQTDRVAFQEALTVMQKRYGGMLVASSELGGGR
jgi:anti-sigma factor RsiW